MKAVAGERRSSKADGRTKEGGYWSRQMARHVCYQFAVKNLSVVTVTHGYRYVTLSILRPYVETINNHCGYIHLKPLSSSVREAVTF